MPAYIVEIVKDKPVNNFFYRLLARLTNYHDVSLW